MNNNQRPSKQSIVKILIFIIILIFLSWGIYLRLAKGYVWADGTGFEGKTLWEWMELLVIPTTLAIATIWFNKKERENELQLAERRAEVDRQIAIDRNQEEVLQSFLDKITELLLDRQLLLAGSESDLQAIAQSRTITALRRLNGERKGILLQFLSSSNLITTKPEKLESFIRLSRTDLRGVNLDEAWMPRADLAEANLSDSSLYRTVLSGAMLFKIELTRANLNRAVLHNARMEGAKLNNANLTGAYLQDANLSLADLSDADLTGANLSNTNLMGAKMKGARISIEQLQQAKTIDGAIMPDGSKHEQA